MKPEQAEAEYRKLMGDAALERQKELAKNYYQCCGNPRSYGHQLGSVH